MTKDTSFRNRDYINKRVIQWISIKNRLPSHEQTVLIWADNSVHKSKFYDMNILFTELSDAAKNEMMKDAAIWPNAFCSLEDDYYFYKHVTHWADISRLKPDDN